jgi:hypothetical protein
MTRVKKVVISSRYHSQKNYFSSHSQKKISSRYESKYIGKKPTAGGCALAVTNILLVHQQSATPLVLFTETEKLPGGPRWQASR